MTKALEATCANGVVTADDLPVPGAEILSDGIGASEGTLILEGSARFYIAKTSPDLQATLSEVVDALDAIANTLTAIAANMLGPATAPPPSLPGNVILINNAKAALDFLKDNLR